MAEVIRNIYIKIERLDWMYDHKQVSAEEYNRRLEYLLTKLEEMRK